MISACRTIRGRESFQPFRRCSAVLMPKPLGPPAHHVASANLPARRARTIVFTTFANASTTLSGCPDASAPTQVGHRPPY